MAPQGTLNLFFLCFSFVYTLNSSSSISALNFVLSSHSKQELRLVSLQVFITSSRGPEDYYPRLWGQPGAHRVEMESERLRAQLRTDVPAQNKWNTSGAIVEVACAFQPLRKIRPRQRVLLSSFQGEGERGKVHFLNSLLALTFWIVLQAVQDQLPDLPRREVDEWTHEKREEGRKEDVHFLNASALYYYNITKKALVLSCSVTARRTKKQQVYTQVY